MRIVVLTGFASISTRAVEAVKLGACHYLAKPSNNRRHRGRLRPDRRQHPTCRSPTAPARSRRWSGNAFTRCWPRPGFNISEAARRLGMHRRTLGPQDGQAAGELTRCRFSVGSDQSRDQRAFAGCGQRYPDLGGAALRHGDRLAILVAHRVQLNHAVAAGWITSSRSPTAEAVLGFHSRPSASARTPAAPRPRNGCGGSSLWPVM